MCGGTAPASTYVCRMSGLSPRVRGNRNRSRSPSVPTRSIPACAGEPAQGIFLAAGERVYPRVCGGTPPLRTARRPNGGLSPRVRGNQVQPAVRGGRPGSIPACAGEPECVTCRTGHQEVYPRVCGGTADDPRRRGESPGLSPRVRGNLGDVVVHDGGQRSIPACAGEPGEDSEGTGIA